MTPADLREWLEGHIGDIFTFMDYEATLQGDDEFRDELHEYWFAGDGPEDRGYRFVHLGHDGSGGQFAAWIKPGSPQIPVVFFGSEGGVGVMVSSLERWPAVLTHAPWISEEHDEPSSVTDVVSSALEDGDEEALEALERYRVAYTERFGPAPALSELLTGLGELNDEFRGWIETDA